jgi:hypothetical protein
MTQMSGMNGNILTLCILSKTIKRDGVVYNVSYLINIDLRLNTFEQNDKTDVCSVWPDAVQFSSYDVGNQNVR